MNYDMFKESNDINTIYLFNKRKIYKSYLKRRALQNPHIVDFNVGEKFMFGRVDRYFAPIKINNTFNLHILDNQPDNTGNDQGKKMIMDFVARSFETMQLYFKQSAENGKISKADPYLSNLKVYKAFEDPTVLYQNYLDVYANVFVKSLKRDVLNIENFDEFMLYIMTMLKKSANEYPFTETGYVKSRLCPISVSGLALEIANMDYEDDRSKIIRFIQSPNWNFYVDACNRFGFMIDMDAPWRIVADVDSKSMRTIMGYHGNHNVDELLMLNYVPVGPYCFVKFKKELFDLYNKIKKKFFYKMTICDGGIVRTKVTPAHYTYKNFIETYDEDYFLEKYMRIRFFENETKYSEAEENRVISIVTSYANLKGTNYAIELFERFIGKPFDYRGSLSYIKRRFDAIAADIANTDNASGGGY